MSSCDIFFLFKQKPAYEMRISDWSSDVCSSDLEKQSAAEADAIKAELLEKLGEAGTGLLDSFTVKAPTVKATPDKEITADMVGSIIKGRKSYRRFTITEKSHD